MSESSLLPLTLPFLFYSLNFNIFVLFCGCCDAVVQGIEQICAGP